MLRRNERPQQILARHLAVSFEHPPQLNIPLPHPPPHRRQLIPRHMRMRVMRHMQIVVQEQQPPERMRLHHIGPQLRMIIRPVLRKRPQVRQRHTRIHHQQQIDHYRNVANGTHPPQHHRNTQRMSNPDAPPSPVPARPAVLLTPERSDRDRRPHRQPTDQGAVRSQRPPPQTPHPRQLPRRQIERLRIMPHLRQPPTRMPMMLNVRPPINLIRHPKRQRQPADRCVHPSQARRMSVNSLVLQ
jgi:hypothetical protein